MIPPGQGGYHMVWAAVSVGGRTGLHVFHPGSVTATNYRYVILDPYVRLYLAATYHNAMLMDDNNGHGRDSQVVKVSDRGRLVTSSSPVPLNIRRVRERCVLNLSRAQTSSRWCGVVVRRGRCQLRCHSSSLDHGSNLQGPPLKALV
ncbi:hypothetical protein TNCV_1292611 [Trichonephila clavipes]|nr:hypothetical protein TNCV_1292611 [Trichonephila clavipes]